MERICICLLFVFVKFAFYLDTFAEIDQKTDFNTAAFEINF